MLKAAYCVDYHEEFVAGDEGNGAYVLHLVLSDPDGWTLQAGGPVAAFVAPVAREQWPKRIKGTATFRNALKAADDFLNEDLKAGAELLANAHPLLYARLQEARRIDDAAYGLGAKAQAKKKAKKAAKKAARKQEGSGPNAPLAPDPAG